MLDEAKRAVEVAPDPFLTITETSQHLNMDPKTVKKLAATRGLPLIELTEGKKGCFLSDLNAWKQTVSRREAVH